MRIMESIPIPGKSKLRWGVALTALLLLLGCAVGPDYHRPSEDVPGEWIGSGQPGQAKEAPATLAAWWQTFNDPVLAGLIERGIKSNLDLKIAVARIRQSRAVLGEARSGFWPSLDLNGKYQRSGSRVPDESGSRTDSSSTTRTGSSTSNLYQSGFDASWELDVFGGVRRGVEAAEADLQASREDLRDVLVTMAGDIGIDYLNLRSLQEQLRITRENLAIQERSAGITRKRYDAGFASGLDLANAQAQVASTRAQIPSREAQISQAIYQISLLLGEAPGALVGELSPVKPIPSMPAQIPAGLPSQLLERRPDIRSSEARLHAATARIGAAKADLFPKFFINGSASLQAVDLKSWSDSVTRLWSIGPSASWNIFNGGFTRSRIEENRAMAEQSLIEYRKTILTALQEVESAWISFDKETQRSASLKTAVENNRRAVELASRLYTEGQNDFLSVLDAQRSLYAAEEALAQSRSQTASQLVTLYKALGGGWQQVSITE